VLMLFCCCWVSCCFLVVVGCHVLVTTDSAPSKVMGVMIEFNETVLGQELENVVKWTSFKLFFVHFVGESILCLHREALPPIRSSS
jgi:hypothetical protein